MKYRVDIMTSWQQEAASYKEAEMLADEMLKKIEALTGKDSATIWDITAEKEPA